MNNIPGIFQKPLEDFWKWLEKQLKPPMIFSAQTLVLLSLYSLSVGILTTGFTQRFIISCGWMFFIAGTAWLMNENPIRINDSILLNYWISGTIICLFVFGYILEQLQQLELWVILPLVVMLITAINDFTDSKLKFHIPNVATRQKLVTLLAVHLLISCWLQFFFVANNLLNDYSTLIGENFNNSAFVIKLPLLPSPPAKGELILSSVLAPVKVKLNNRPWSEIAGLIQLPDHDSWIRDIHKAVLTRLSPGKEKSLWNIDTDVTSEDWGYKLELSSIWTGPTSHGQGIKFSSECEIKRVNTESGQIKSQSAIIVSSTSKIECQQITKTRVVLNK